MYKARNTGTGNEKGNRGEAFRGISPNISEILLKHSGECPENSGECPQT